MSSFEKALESRVLVCDGAMGTMLYAQGAFVNRSFDELNVTRPELVAGVHRAYVDAGVDVIETNTFGANRVKLESFGLADQLPALNAAGVALARQAAGSDVFVAGALGPLGLPVEPHGQTTLVDAGRYFREQAEALMSSGVDLFVLETFRSVDELAAAVSAVRAVSPLPIVAELTITDTGEAPDGVPPEAFGPRLVDVGATVVGVNCGAGAAGMLEAVERLRSVTTAPLAAQPNAGLPRQVEGRSMYMSSPEYLASYARRFASLGVRLVGGCCGTTPEHVRQIASALPQPV